ncbi:MAG: PilZ domain-containing protein [Polyangia bacterium]|jgi:hypothetical protein|nr:PilZ domain-containing protein [Polyangia bacterium]
MSLQEDARKHQRTQLEVTVDWQLIGTEDVMWSATDDLGEGGVRIRTLTPPEQGSQVVVVLNAVELGLGVMRIPARVAWTRVDDDFCGMGVAFEPSTDEERSAIKELLAQVLARKKA